MSPEIYRPTFGRFLCGAIWLISVISVGRELFAEPSQALRLLPWAALASLAVWALYWRPRLEISPAAVRIVNVTRTVDLPWPAIQRLDTKWALTLFTAYGKVTAWAAPAPGLRSRARIGAVQKAAVPRSAVIGGAVRPGDLPGSPSGDAALAVRRRFEQLQEGGFLDDPKLEFARPPTQWHLVTLVALVVLAVGCVLTIVL